MIYSAAVEARSDYSSAAAGGVHAAVIYLPFCALFLVGPLLDYQEEGHPVGRYPVSQGPPPPQDVPPQFQHLQAPRAVLLLLGSDADSEEESCVI